MQTLIPRIMMGFLAAFIAACVAVIVYQLVWAGPAERCEAGRGWWDPATRQCGKVIYIPDLTGRYVSDGREGRVRMPNPEQLAGDSAAADGSPERP